MGLHHPVLNYVDESVYFTDTASFVHSFMTKYDDLWTNTACYANYANVTGALTRDYPSVHQGSAAELPAAGSRTRPSRRPNNKETQKIDVIMYRITDKRHTDAMIAAQNRGSRSA